MKQKKKVIVKWYIEWVDKEGTLQRYFTGVLCRGTLLRYFTEVQAEVQCRGTSSEVLSAMYLFEVPGAFTLMYL